MERLRDQMRLEYSSMTDRAHQVRVKTFGPLDWAQAPLTGSGSSYLVPELLEILRLDLPRSRHRARIFPERIDLQLLGHENAVYLKLRQVQALQLVSKVPVPAEEDDFVEQTLVLKIIES